MTVSKRTRYEVLRRDDHRCRYCGATAPTVTLEVDHVIPVALGGSDLPTNLVAACQDCNNGKGSTGPTDALVADVRDEALRFAELTQQAYAVLVERIGSRDDYIDDVEDTFKRFALPPDWRQSVGRWFEMGVPAELLIDAAETALGKGMGFKYMCGIVWNQVQTVTSEAEKRRTFDGAWMTDDALTEERIAAYQKGLSKGQDIAQDAGEAAVFSAYRGEIFGGMLLKHVIDGRTAEIPERFRWVAA